MKRYYLFGLQRSGTNFIGALLSQITPRGYDDLLNRDGGPHYIWKHIYNEEPPTDDPIVYVLKHPEKWYRSIQNTWVDMDLHPHQDIEKLWEEHVNFWVPRASYVLRYEDVIKDTEHYFGNVSRPKQVFMNNGWTEDREKKALEGLTPHALYDSIESTPLW